MPDTKEAEVQFIDSSSGYNSWPMITTAGKRLICLYSCGKAHDIWEPFRKVCARCSDDGGKHWSNPVEVVDSNGCGDVPIGKGNDNNGSALFWVRCSGKTDFRHELYRTVDGCAFERITVFRGNPVPMQITDIFYVPDVGMMALWFAGSYAQTACSNSWGTLISTDNGYSWKQQTMEKDLTKGEWPTEPSAVYLGNGRILAIARAENFSGDIRQFQLQSNDHGRTWTRTLTNIGDVAESSPSLLYDGKTGLIHCYYYQRGAGLLKRRIGKTDEIWNRSNRWPDPEIVCHGSPEAEHAGNVNVCLWGTQHVAAFYSGTERQTSVVMATLSAEKIRS